MNDNDTLETRAPLDAPAVPAVREAQATGADP